MQRVFTALRIVFYRPRSFIGAGGIACAILIIIGALPTVSLIADILGNAIIPLTRKYELVLALLRANVINMGLFSAVTTLCIALLFGINMVMIMHELKRKKAGIVPQRVAVLSFGALMSGTLGIGCAACGSLVGIALLPFIGATGALALLPFDGAEFNILSIALLLLSIFLISRKITAPLVCKQ